MSINTLVNNDFLNDFKESKDVSILVSKLNKYISNSFKSHFDENNLSIRVVDTFYADDVFSTWNSLKKFLPFMHEDDVFRLGRGVMTILAQKSSEMFQGEFYDDKTGTYTGRSIDGMIHYNDMLNEVRETIDNFEPDYAISLSYNNYTNDEAS